VVCIGGMYASWMHLENENDPQFISFGNVICVWRVCDLRVNRIRMWCVKAVVRPSRIHSHTLENDT